MRHIHIRVPAALPGFTAGLRLVAVHAPIGTIIGEWVGRHRGSATSCCSPTVARKPIFAALIVLTVFTRRLDGTAAG